MKSNWKTVKLQELGRVVGGATPSTKNEAFYGGSIPWLTPKDLADYSERYISKGERSITEEGLNSCSTELLPAGTVLFSSRAPIGYVAIASNPICTNQGFKSVVPDTGVVDPLFLYYLLVFNKEKIKSAGSGTTFKEVSGNVMKNIEVEIPTSVDYQRKIAQILGSIDNQIESNGRINKNLAEQIQAFLNYVLSTGNENDAVRFGDLLYIKGRIGWKGLKKDEYLANSDYRIINGESLTPEGIDWTKTGFITQERYDESPEIMLKLGDILLSKDGTIGKIGYIDKLDLPTTVASGIFVIRNSTKGEYGTPFLYYLLTSNRFKGFIKARTEGSVIPHLYQKDFMEFTFPKPDPELLKQFNEFSQPLFETIQNKIRENRQLAILRDKLLAKLLSGDIEIQ